MTGSIRLGPCGKTAVHAPESSFGVPLRSVRLKALWANSYFVATMGDSTLEAANAMSRSDARSKPNSHLRMAEARGLAGDF
jgi:hypothetical protein